MFISEIKVYEFLKDKLKFLDSDAKKYAKQIASIEEKLHGEIREGIQSEMKLRDYVTRQDLKELAVELLTTKQDLQLSISKLENKLEVKMERNTSEIIKWMIGFYALMAGLVLAVIKMFF